MGYLSIPCGRLLQLLQQVVDDGRLRAHGRWQWHAGGRVGPRPRPSPGQSRPFPFPHLSLALLLFAVARRRGHLELATVRQFVHL